MSLSSEQKKDLDRLNKLFKPYNHLAEVNDEAGELAVHENMVEQFPIGDYDRDRMNELSDKRRALLQQQSKGSKLRVK
jgi:hypothetical protein